MKPVLIRTVLFTCIFFIAGTAVAQNSSERQVTPVPELQTNYPRPETQEIRPVEMKNVKVQVAKADTPPVNDKNSATPAMEAKVENPKAAQPVAENAAPSKH